MVDEIKFPEPERGPQGQREVGELPEGYKVEGGLSMEEFKSSMEEFEARAQEAITSIKSKDFILELKRKGKSVEHFIAVKVDKLERIRAEYRKNLIEFNGYFDESTQLQNSIDQVVDEIAKLDKKVDPTTSLYESSFNKLNRVYMNYKTRLNALQERMMKIDKSQTKLRKETFAIQNFINDKLDTALINITDEIEITNDRLHPFLVNPELDELLNVPNEPIPSQEGIRKNIKQEGVAYKNIQEQLRQKMNEREQIKTEYDLLDIDKSKYLLNPKGKYANKNPENSSAYKQYVSKQNKLSRQHDILTQEISELEESLNKAPSTVKINALDYSTQKSLYEQYKPEIYGSTTELSIDEEFRNAQEELRDIQEQIQSLGDEPSEPRQLQKWEQRMSDLEDSEIMVQRKLDALQAQLQSRSVGFGLKKRRGRPKGSGIAFKDNIDHAKGIQPVKKYHPFGKYFVNSHKLNNGNVLSIKSKSGTNIREYPSRTVSPHLGHVIKTIIGGGVPSWNDMSKLSEDEKDYLYKISKRAEFADKITIPTPSKDREEKDIHEFEVCKGEIMAGNDSKELIKKFKLLIIKLSKNGSIPKREASEVMQELLELGY
jgi:hypothetical protein